MADFALKVPDPVADVLGKLHPSIKSHIRIGLEAVIEDPRSGKSLREELQGLRSYRVKRYRIIYRFNREQRCVKIVAVGPRRIIYEETFRLVTQEMGRKSLIRDRFDRELLKGIGYHG
jgi:mRNA interferase RelE/StbE